jgi:hypothetical protein
MKKLIIALAFLMVLPFNALALQALNEDDMGAITGQAGVSIAIDDVMIYQNIEYLRYTDNDGVNGTEGSVSISNLYMMVHINGITNLDADGRPFSPNRPVQGTYHLADQAGNALTYTNSTGPVPFLAHALTIDVGTMPILSAGMSNNYGGATVNVAGVRIGLPTVEIHQTALSFDVTVSSPGAANSGASYGNISIGANTMAVLDGWVEIAPH